jgi:hypothetical protein
MLRANGRRGATPRPRPLAVGATATEAARRPFAAGAPQPSAGVESCLLTSEDTRQFRTRTTAPG